MSKLGREIDLLANYPRAHRDLNARLVSKSPETRKIARKFGFDYFDGDRKYGYGGFQYNPKFWQPVIPVIMDRYNLEKSAKVLDVGCAKGFFLYDVKQLYPDTKIYGIDISEYAIENSIPEVKSNLMIGNAKSLPFETGFFDFVISINTIHNLELSECADALREIERVSSGNSFITVDAYRNEAEKKRMLAWNLTALTIMSVVEWKDFFVKVGYSGDFFWFTP